ncbi:MAG: carbonic anhydrase [Nitrospirota bacterium]
MKKKLVALGFTVVVSLAAVLVSAESGPPAISADESLLKLMDGNKHYVENKLTNHARCDAAVRTSLTNSQKPYAIVLSCSDSRVPPEIIFDKALGELFVVRVAGNVPDPIVLGSIEYAAEHLGSPLIMVLGHERCGAVKATVDSKGKSTGSENIDAIVKTVATSIDAANKNCAPCNGNAKCAETNSSEFVECLVTANAKHIAGDLTKRSHILKHLAEEGKIKIVAAKYDLDDGVVTILK